MYKKILIGWFMWEFNSANILVDEINHDDKFYIENDFLLSEKQIEVELDKNIYDLIIILWQKPKSDKIFIETRGKRACEEYFTNFDYHKLTEFIKEENFLVNISQDAGNYLCNNIFFKWLKHVKDNKLKTEIIFIHIPWIEDWLEIKKLWKAFNNYLKFLQ